MPVQRPLAVTFISWSFMIWALLSLIPKTLLVVDPDAYRLASEFHEEISKQGLLEIPLWLQLGHSFAGAAVFLIAGSFMLRGKFWAMVVFLAWIAGVLALTLASTGLSVPFFAKLVIAALVAAFLLKPGTRRFFRSGKG